MRLEATIPDARREQLRVLQDELKLTKSQVLDEALSIFMKAYMETKRGNRLAIIDPDSQRTVCEVASPALSQVEWAAFHRKVKLSGAAGKKVRALIKHRTAPTASLKKAMRKKKSA